MELQKAVHQEFRNHGLTLRKASVKLVASTVAPLMDEAPDALSKLVEYMLEALEKRNMRSSILDEEVVKEVIDSLQSDDVHEASTEIISAFDVPKFSYDLIARAFWRVKSAPSVFASAQAKIALYQERLLVLQHRVLRNKFFNRPALEMACNREYAELTSVQGLLQSAGENKYLLGVLTEVEDGVLFLEDATGVVRVDLSNAVPITGLFTENCIVIAEGALRKADAVFEVAFLGFPPTESRDDFREATGGENFFGGETLRPEDVAELKEREAAATDDMFLVLADVWLDRPECMAALETVLDAFNNTPTVPSHIVLMGNFLFHPLNIVRGNLRDSKAHFDALADMICAYPRLVEHTTFVFVPGPNDPSPSPALPRPPLPALLTQSLKAKLPKAVFASNPCRLRFHSQEMVLFRSDMQSRMRRVCHLEPSQAESASLFEHMATTVLSQGHLCPLPLTLQPVYWDYDHALRLYSSPHTLVLADYAAEQTEWTEARSDCNVFNPGCFGNNRHFAVYYPGKRSVELSVV